MNLKRSVFPVPCRKVAAIALASIMAACAFGDVLTIPENGTFTMGGVGASAANGDPNNIRERVILFQPGSTLVITQINGSASIWPILIATNGAATVRGLNLSAGVTFQNHVFAFGDGSLTLEDMPRGVFGHSTVKSVVKLDNLRLGSNVPNVAVFQNSTVLAFPTDPSIYSLSDGKDNMVRLCGDTDMFPGQDVISVNKCIIQVCNPAAFPAGKTFRVTGGSSISVNAAMPPDYREGIDETRFSFTDLVSPVEGFEYGFNAELAGGCKMMFDKKGAATAFNGSVAGYGSACGNIDLAGGAAVTLGGDNSGFTGKISPSYAYGSELVLSNANAAVNATVQMDQPMTLRGAEGIAAVSVGTTAGGADAENCRLDAASNQTVSVGSVSGALSVTGGGAGAGSVVNVTALAPDAMVYDDKSATVNLPAGAFRATKTEGNEEVIVMPGASGAFDASAHNGFTQMPTFEAPDGSLIVNGTNSLTVSAAAGVEASVAAGDGSVCSVAGEGAFNVDTSGLLIKETGWWFDFSRADTRFCVGYGATNIVDRYHAQNQQEPYIERVVDWRKPDDTYSLWNRRLYGTKLEYVTTVYSYIPTTTQNGLEYMSMGTKTDSRRLPFSDGTGKTNAKSCEAQLVVMVFSAQNGGGYAMVATEEGAFGRSGTGSANGMTTNTLHDIWKDGVKVDDPTTATFTKGWQVLSVAMDGLHFNGLGFLKEVTVSPKTYGGQDYGEVLIFTNAVSERVRLEAEWYLAKKWGLDSVYSSSAVAQLKALRDADPIRVAASGGVTVKAGENTVSVEGQFAGTVNLDGGTLVVADRSLPCTEADIPSEGRLYWADPDDEATLLRYRDLGKDNSAARPDEVRAIKDKAARSFTVNQPALYGVGNRMPYLVRQSRGIGPERGWLDFNNLRDADTDGNSLRFLNYPSDSDARAALDNGTAAVNVLNSMLATMNVRTAFFVLDSVRGGGNLLARTVTVDYGTTRRATGKWSEPIWINDKPAAFGNGENRLNSEIVDHRNGFTGKPEVYALRGTGTYNAPFIGCYQNSEGGLKRGEIIGELLLYSSELSDNAVKGIEAYLMGKWLGRLPDGYADIRKATVTGSGTVNVAVAAQMPRFDSGFVGSVNVADGVFKVVVDPDTGLVTGALDCPNAALSLPAACSVTVDFTSRPAHSASGSYTLVRGASGMAGVAWTYTAGANAPSSGVFVNTGSAIVYRFAPRGAVFTFR